MAQGEPDNSRAVARLLNDFFGPENAIGLADIEGRSNASAECTRQWLQAHETGSPRLLLPRASEGLVEWYAMTLDVSDLRDLREQLMAFVGPSYSSFRGARASVNSGDPSDAAIIRYAGDDPVVFRLHGEQSKEGRAAIADALSLLEAVHARCQKRRPSIHRALPIVLRDLHMALVAENELEATEALDYIRSNRLLDGLNVQFLQVQLLSHFGRSAELLDLPCLPDLIRVRRPPLVTEALICAVYDKHLKECIEQGDGDALVSEFIASVRPHYGKLTLAPTDAKQDNTLVYLMTEAATSVPPARETFLECRERLPEGHLGTGLLASLTERAGQPGPDETDRAAVLVRDQLAMSMAAGEYAGVIEIAALLADPVEKSRALLECAFEAQTNATDAAAVVAVEALDEAARSELFASRKLRVFWGALSRGRLAGQDDTDAATVPAVAASDWFEWFDLVRMPGVPDARLTEIAARGAREWQIDPLVASAENRQGYIRELRDASGNEDTRHRLQRSFPQLVSFFQADAEYPRPVLLDVYRELRAALAVFCALGTQSDFDVLRELAEIDLDLGMTAAEYGEFLEQVGYVWDQFKAPATLSSGLDLLDLLAYYPCPKEAHEGRLQVATRVLSDAIPWRENGRVDRETWLIAVQLAGELGLTGLVEGIAPPTAPSETEDLDDPLSLLPDSIGIHTLTESAGLRAKRLIEDRSPQTSVTVNADRVGTDRLRELCRSADILVVVTRSAKHAATDYIRKHRGNLPLLYPSGKGTSSILTELAEHLRSTAAVA